MRAESVSWLDALAEGDQVLVARHLRADVVGTVVRITKNRQFVVKCWNREVRFSRRGWEIARGYSPSYLREWTAEAGAAAEAAREQEQLEARFADWRVFAGLPLETLREIDRLVKAAREATLKVAP